MTAAEGNITALSTSKADKSSLTATDRRVDARLQADAGSSLGRAGRHDGGLQQGSVERVEGCGCDEDRREDDCQKSGRSELQNRDFIRRDNYKRFCRV